MSTENPEKLNTDEMQAVIERMKQKAIQNAKQAPSQEQSTDAKNRYLQRLMQEAGIMPVDWGANWQWEPTRGPEKYRNDYTNVWKPRIRNYCDRISDYIADGQGVFLGGSVGIGKTGLLALIALEAMQAGITTAYVESGAILALRIFERFDRRNNHEDIQQDFPFWQSQLLIIDDIDDVKFARSGSSSIEWIGRLIKHRIGHKQTVCVGSNLSWQELLALPEMDGRVMDRLRSKMVFSMELEGASQR